MTDAGSAARGLTAAEYDHYRTWGYVRLGQAMPAAPLEDIGQRISRWLDARPLYRGGNWNPLEASDKDHLQTSRDLKKMIKGAPWFDVADEELLADLARLHRVPVTRLNKRAQLLFTRPGADTWAVPHNIWHVDYPRLASGKAPGTQVFGFLTPTPTRGGGTLIVAGSQALFNDDGFIASGKLKKRLAHLPWFSRLFNPRSEQRDQMFADVDEVDGVPLRVVEVTGEPGDLYLMDLRVLHTLAPNASTRPRLMFTQRYLRHDCLAEVAEKYGWPAQTETA